MQDTSTRYLLVIAGGCFWVLGIAFGVASWPATGAPNVPPHMWMTFSDICWRDDHDYGILWETLSINQENEWKWNDGGVNTDFWWFLYIFVGHVHGFSARCCCFEWCSYMQLLSLTTVELILRDPTSFRIYDAKLPHVFATTFGKRLVPILLHGTFKEHAMCPVFAAFPAFPFQSGDVPFFD